MGSTLEGFLDQRPNSLVRATDCMVQISTRSVFLMVRKEINPAAMSCSSMVSLIRASAQGFITSSPSSSYTWTGRPDRVPWRCGSICQPALAKALVTTRAKAKAKFPQRYLRRSLFYLPPVPLSLGRIVLPLFFMAHTPLIEGYYHRNFSPRLLVGEPHPLGVL